MGRTVQPDRSEVEAVLGLVASEAARYLASVDGRPAMAAGAGEAARS